MRPITRKLIATWEVRWGDFQIPGNYSYLELPHTIIIYNMRDGKIFYLAGESDDTGRAPKWLNPNDQDFNYWSSIVMNSQPLPDPEFSLEEISLAQELLGD